MGCFYFEHFVFVMCFVTDCQRGSLLGSKTLGTNVLELQFVICWQTMIKIESRFRLAQSVFNCKIGIK